MKAATITANGGPEVFEYADMPDPVAAPGQVVVDIVNATVNGADWKVRAGKIDPIPAFPYILGRDFSGHVSAVGDGVTDLSTGDAVFGVCDVGQEGAYAEKIAMRADLVCKKPEWISHEHAASLALTGLTALVTIEDTLNVQAGERLVVEGGAGGVASFAIQVAKHIGAHVITTCSTKNLEYVSGLGADQVIDYTTEDVVQAAGLVDCVFDTVGGEVATRAYTMLKSGGRAAFIASGPTAPENPRDDVQGLRPKVGRDRPHLQRILDLVEAKAIQMPEITFYELKDAAEAHRVSEGRHLRGKLIFKVG